jgi:hypothetical protein
VKFSLTVAATCGGPKLPAGAGSATPWKWAIRRARMRISSAVVEAAHHDHMLQTRLVISVGEREAVVALHHRPHTEVQGGSQAPAEPHLLFAHESASLRCSVVEEGEDHGLAQLEGQRGCEEHPGNMRLAHLDSARPVLIEAGLRHRDGDLVDAISARIGHGVAGNP